MKVEPGWQRRSLAALALAFIACMWWLTIYLANACYDDSRWQLVVSSGATGCFEFWLNRYQQLIAGITALAAALITVHYMRRQIEQADAHERVRRHGRLAATLSTLPFALSDILEYAGQCVRRFEEVYSRVHDADRNKVISLQSVSLPVPPKGAMDILKDCIEVSDQQESIALSDLAYVIQIQSARINDDWGTTAGYQELKLGERIMEALEVYELAAALFDFARRRSPAPKPIRLRSAATICGLHEEIYPKLFARIDRRNLIRDRLKQPEST